jgi:hypothetical protein
MSALPPKADMCSAPAHVCFGPIADIALRYSMISARRGMWTTALTNRKSRRAKCAPMKRRWLVWLLVSLFLCAYTAGGYVASLAVTTNLRLEPGTSIDLPVFRLADDNLQVVLKFKGDYVQRRAELGEWRTRASEKDSGFLRFETPGAPVRLRISSPEAAAVVYEAMPISAHGVDGSARRLTSDLSVGPGVWRWPPHYQDLALHGGTNRLKIDIVSVGPPLVGETVKLVVLPALGFKVVKSSNTATGLFLWFLWPVFLAVQLIWAFMLIRAQRRTRAAHVANVRYGS